MLRAILFLLAAGAAHAQNGSISGVVVEKGSNAPIRKALVTARESRTARSGPPRMLQVPTADDGAFLIPDLTPGKYYLIVEKTGYIAQSGKFSNEGVDVSPGKDSPVASLELLKQGIITGHVYDVDGDPVEHAQITIWPINGRRSSNNSPGGTQTDDRGEFRIPRLNPGSYRVLAVTNTGQGAATISRQVNAPTYYPSALDEASSAAVQVGAGEERGGVDIRLKRSVAVRISGQVTGDISKETGVQVMLQPAPSNAGRRGMIFTGMTGAPADGDGKFFLSNVLPGSYMLVANSYRKGGNYMGVQPIQVGQQDIDGISIALGAPAAVTGRLRFPEGSKPKTGMNLQLTPLDPNRAGFLGGAGARVAEDGTFVFQNAQRQRMALSANLPNGFYVRALSVGGRESTSLEVDLTGGDTTLEVIIGDKPATLSGKVEVPETAPKAANRMVVVVELTADGAMPLGLNGSSFKTSTVSPTGEFKLDGLRPGNYKVLSMDGELLSMLFELGNLPKFTAKGVDVKLEEGVTTTANPRLIVDKDVDPE